MAHKELKFNEDARRALERGRSTSLADGQGDAGPEGSLRRARQEVRRPDHHDGSPCP